MVPNVVLIYLMFTPLHVLTCQPCLLFGCIYSNHLPIICGGKGWVMWRWSIQPEGNRSDTQKWTYVYFGQAVSMGGESIYSVIELFAVFVDFSHQCTRSFKLLQLCTADTFAFSVEPGQQFSQCSPPSSGSSISEYLCQRWELLLHPTAPRVRCSLSVKQNSKGQSRDKTQTHKLHFPMGRLSGIWAHFKPATVSVTLPSVAEPGFEHCCLFRPNFFNAMSTSFINI